MIGGSELLRRGLEALEIREDAEMLARFDRFLEELARWNARFGLVKGRGDELIVKHVFDSLAAYPLLVSHAARSPVLDVGSGAGFPGIPMAIVLPALRFTLCERSKRKCSFLQSVAAHCGLKNVAVVDRDLAELEGVFPLVMFRAVSPLARFLEELWRSPVHWNEVLAYQGTLKKVVVEVAAVIARRPEVRIEVRQLRVPFLDAERHAVLIS